MSTAGQQAEQAAQQESAYDPGSLGATHRLEWLFKRPDIPTGVKRRFWTWANVIDLRLSNLFNIENLNTILSQFDLDVGLYFNEKMRKDEKISEKIITWINQLKATVRLNILASLGENRDMELITKSRGEWKQTVEQELMGEEE